ncbi:unnamed protein product, partial [Brassica rapa]
GSLIAHRTSAPPPPWGALVLYFNWSHWSSSCWQGDLLLLEGPAADDSAGHP